MVFEFTEAEKRDVAGRARTLRERMDDPSVHEVETGDGSSVAETVSEWESEFRDEDAFAARLAMDGLEKSDCGPLVRTGGLSEDASLPDWIDELEDLIETVCDGEPDEYPRRFDAPDGDAQLDHHTDDRRFGPFTAALADYVHDRLDEHLDGEVLSDAAVQSLKEWFRVRVQNRFTRILYVEFKTFVYLHDQDLAYADPDDFDDPPTEYYDEFLQYLFDDGFSDLVDEYPMFGRLIVEMFDQWVENVRTFRERVESDGPALMERFDLDHEPGRVVDLVPLADDTHSGGQAIMKVEFEAGPTVVYKPRSVAAGATFYGFVDDLEGELPLPEFRKPTYLEREEYGWMEWIEYRDCPDEAAVRRYYERAGGLIAIAYFLGLTDCQYENLLVEGEHPVLLDVETVLHPYADVDGRATKTGAESIKDRSVLLTDLLPFELDSSYGGKNDAESGVGDGASNMPRLLSGIAVSSADEELTDVERPVFKAGNTDVMSVVEAPTDVDRDGNVPKVDGTDQPPSAYVDRIVDGFESTYRTMLRLRDDGRLSELLGSFEGIENRYVHRATMEYGNAINALTSRSRLKDGVQFGIGIERLAASYFDADRSRASFDLYDSERRSLESLEPPRFASTPDGTHVEIHGQRLDAPIDQTGLQRCRRRIRDAGEDDLDRQVEIVRRCFGDPPINHEEIRRASRSVTGAVASTDDAIDDGDLTTEAIELFERVEDAAIETSGGTYEWTALGPSSETDGLTLQTVGHDLYSGNCGIALFAAALFRVTGEDRYRDFALETLSPVRDEITAAGGRGELPPFGGFAGLGGIAYAVGTVGSLLEVEDLWNDAVKTADYVNDELIESDASFDVIKGAAGSITCLLGLYDEYEDPELESTAIACGDHLLSNRIESDSGHDVWKAFDHHPPLTGFAHGASGIAYALLKLWEVTGDGKYRDAANETLAYESQFYSPDHGNWEDRRMESAYHDQWCYGRSGIGLARLGMAEHADDVDALARGIERITDMPREVELSTYDHLCCGNAGKLEFLLELQVRSDRFRGAATELAGKMVRRKETIGSYCLQSHTRHSSNPTLFTGLSGIGYGLLRVSNPGEIPCILLME